MVSCSGNFLEKIADKGLTELSVDEARVEAKIVVDDTINYQWSIATWMYIFSKRRKHLIKSAKISC